MDQLLSLQQSDAHAQEIESLIQDRKAYLKDHPSDIYTQAVLAALHSNISVSEATQYASSLPPISSFTKNVDVQQLESQGIPSNTSSLVRKRETSQKARPRKRRARAGKVFDPTKEVDPERWLPLRERSYYKPSKTKRKKLGGATQGGFVDGEAMGRSGNGHVETKKSDGAGKKKKNRK